MTRMDERQMEQLARLVWMLRAADGMPEWDGPGIIAKLREAAPTASSWDLARAAINLAENRELRTPGVLPQPGPHWQRPDGSKSARRGGHTMRCPEHGEPYLRCQQCAAIESGPPPGDVKAEIDAALEAAKTAHHQRDAAQAERNERKTR